MRIVKFAKLDLIRTRRYLWILAYSLLGLIFLLRSPDSNGSFPIFFGLFGALILGLFPFQIEQRAESGFTRMLPSREGEDILGHYFYGACVLIASYLVALTCVAVANLFIPTIDVIGRPETRGIYHLLLGGGFLVMGLQYLGMTVFRFQTARGYAYLRIVPAMVFFGVGQFLSGAMEGKEGTLSPAEITDVQGSLAVVGAAALAAGIIVYIILALISVRIDRNRK